jgi:hypothetical protein
MRILVGRNGYGRDQAKKIYQKTEDNRKFCIHRANWKVSCISKSWGKGLTAYLLIYLSIKMAGTLTASFTSSVACLPVYLVGRCWKII